MLLVGAAPIWPAAFGEVFTVDNSYSPDRGVRVLAVFEGRASALTALGHVRINVFDVLSDEEKRSDRVGNIAAVINAMEDAGVYPEQLEDYWVFSDPPKTRGKNVTGWSSTGAIYADWWLMSTSRCLNEPTAFSLVAVDREEIWPVAGIDHKADAAEKHKIRTLVVAGSQPPFDFSGDIIYVDSYPDLVAWLTLNTTSCVL